MLELIETKKKTVLTVTGGGTAVFPRLLEHGGGSHFLVEGIINYASKSTQDLLGAIPEKYTTETTARQLAVAAYNRCVELGVDKKEAHGVSATAKLALTDREERQGRTHEISLAYHSVDTTISTNLPVIACSNRGFEEQTCTNLILHFMESVYLYQPFCTRSFRQKTDMLASLVVQGLSEGYIYNSNIRLTELADCTIFPGSFNPIHEQHIEMCRVANKLTGKKVWLEISISNTDKPQLDFITLNERLVKIEEKIGELNDFIGGIIIVDNPLFARKSYLYPKGTTFLVGADTYNRINSPYYDVDSLVEAFKENNQGLLVFKRTGVELDRPGLLRHYCNFVSDSQYKDTGVSSSQIRGNYVS